MTYHEANRFTQQLFGGLLGASYPTKLILAHRSGGRCAFPGCDTHLVHEGESGESTVIGEAAHVFGEKPGAARYAAAMSDAERNAVKNLIYMCPNHHTVIDKLPDAWPADVLLKLKNTHEARAFAAMGEAFASVEFPELEAAVAWISFQPPTLAEGFALIPPEEKIQKNRLTDRSRNLIAMGLVARKVVHEFVEAETQQDNDFPERLRSGFLSEYHRLRKGGHTGDELFELMCAFAEKGFTKRVERAAGLSVLVYLFEVCDVFEK